MSSNIWTPAEPSSNRTLSDFQVWRIVETQYRVSTMKLVESLNEQTVLEQIIEQTKPPVPPECENLHYLLFPPFRYPPHPKGSRFRHPAASEGVFYAASCPETAVAEAAFYRMLFFAESPGLPFPKNPNEYTLFSAIISSPTVIDLTQPPYASNSETWMHPNQYQPCQEFADAARTTGIEVICYASVRDPDHRNCFAILRCCAFVTPPDNHQTWQLLASESGVYAYCQFPRYGKTYPLDMFLQDERLAPLKVTA